MNENLKSPSLEIIERDLTLRLILRGQWDYELPKELISRLFLACKRDGVRVSVSLLGVSSLDYSAATLLLELSMAVKRRGGEWMWEEVPPAIAPILGIVKGSKRDLPAPPPSLSSLLRLGEKIKESLKGLGRFASFLGETLFAMGRSLKESRLIRLKATLYHIEESGIKAVPIIALTSFLVGIVMAYQGAIQLEKFGASIIVVEMTGMLTLRELGPVIAAIVVAGRSASSYAAQIGVMKITEEIDAMKTMNFNPYAFLVIPRVIALVVVMPLVIFLSNVAGLLGE
ncbi:MAG: ABC transporter permease, partial [Wolinella sp.]